ncbi:MAG TPA: sugar phosphate isomerase/epimerase [Salegentibacter sp.]|nr:sugar phosphate isomerase/epimerase [Salegentibacter sp.]
MIKRRSFLKQTGLALAATAILPNELFSWNAKDYPIGLQLYSLRNTIGEDLRGTIEKVAKVGFKEVETYGYSTENGFWDLSVSEFKNLLNNNGLTSPSGHYGADKYLGKDGRISDFQEVLSAAKGLGQKYVIIPYIGDTLRTSIDDYKRIADKLNEAGERCKEAGLKLAYHNHAFEFENYGDKNGYEVLLNNTEKDLVFFEMDIYWVVRAEKDPVNLFQKYPGRFPLWHVKDMDKTNTELNTEIGSGSIDFKKIFEKAKEAGAEHFILEQENFAMEPYESLEQSFGYIKNNLISS